MTTPLQQHSPQYQALLARWSQLVLKQDRDGLTRQEAAELAGIREQLGAVEMAHDARQQEARDAAAVASLGVLAQPTDYEAQLEYGDYGGCEG